MKIMYVPSLLLLIALSTAHAEAPKAAENASVPAKIQATPEIIKQIGEIRDLRVLNEVIKKARRAGDTLGEMAALDRRIAIRPHISAFKLDKAASLARDNQKSAAYTLLIELQNTGYSFDIEDEKAFANIADTQVWEYLNTNFAANGEHYGEGRLAYTFPREDLMLESLAFDTTRYKMLVGSAREGAIYAADSDGKLTPVVKADAENGMWSVLDIAVDTERGVLWASSAALPYFKNYNAEKDLGKFGIFKFDLKTGKLISRYSSIENAQGEAFYPKGLVLGADGEVYVSNALGRGIYQIRDDKFKRILQLPMMTGISAITMSGDGKLLYMADPGLGLIGLDVTTLKPFDVLVPPKLTLEGITGLHWTDKGLVVIQGGMSPKRIMGFGLSPKGDTIVDFKPIESSNPLFKVLGASTLYGTKGYVIVNDQKSNYDRYGLLKNKDLLEGTQVLSFDINYTPSQANETPVMSPGL